MTRWTLLISACFLQILGLLLMWRGKHFSLERPKGNMTHKRARRSGRLLLAAGALALGAFAMRDSDMLLLAGQGILILLCLAGTPGKRNATQRKGQI